MATSTQCLNCKNYEFNGCKAYPIEIPYQIFSGQHDHTKPFPKDNGIRFEPKEQKNQKN